MRWSAKRRQPAADPVPGPAGGGHRAADAAGVEFGRDQAGARGGSIQRLAGRLPHGGRDARDASQRAVAGWNQPPAVHEPLHAERHQHDDAADAAAERLEPKSGGQSGQLGQRLRRQSAGRPAGRRPGAGRDEHRPDGGAVEPSEFRPSADGGDRRHHSPAPGGAGQPAGQSGQHQFADPGGQRPRRARLPGADEPAPAILGAVDRWRGRAATGAKPDQRADGSIRWRAAISRPAARRPAVGLGHDALRLDDHGLVDRADAADDDPVADGP